MASRSLVYLRWMDEGVDARLLRVVRRQGGTWIVYTRRIDRMSTRKGITMVVEDVDAMNGWMYWDVSERHESELRRLEISE